MQNTHTVFKYELCFWFIFLTLHWISSVLCFSEILSPPHSMGVLLITSLWPEFYLGEPYSFHPFVSKPKSILPYTTMTELEIISKSSILYILPSFTWKKRTHAYIHILILCVATVYIHFSFQPKIRMNSLALFSHKQVQIFL